MTSSGDFLPFDPNRTTAQEDLINYPTAFGVRLTPRIQAIGLTLLGLAAAYALFNVLVKPVLEEKTRLEAEVADKQAQLDQQASTLQGVADLRADLDQSLAQRVEVYGLLGNSKSLDTLLLDINQQIQASNAAIADALRTPPIASTRPSWPPWGLTPPRCSGCAVSLAPTRPPKSCFTPPASPALPRPPPCPTPRVRRNWPISCSAKPWRCRCGPCFPRL